jgi:hypothetical protein
MPEQVLKSSFDLRQLSTGTSIPYLQTNQTEAIPIASQGLPFHSKAVTCHVFLFLLSIVHVSLMKDKNVKQVMSKERS